MACFIKHKKFTFNVADTKKLKYLHISYLKDFSCAPLDQLPTNLYNALLFWYKSVVLNLKYMIFDI